MTPTLPSPGAHGLRGAIEIGIAIAIDFFSISIPISIAIPIPSVVGSRRSRVRLGSMLVRLLDADDQPVAIGAVPNVGNVPDLVEGIGDAVGLLADQSGEVDAGDDLIPVALYR